MAPTPESSALLRTFAFGVVGEPVWLAGWFASPTGVLLLGGGPDGGVDAREAQIEPSDDGEWRVSAPGAQLTIAATSRAAQLGGVEGLAEGFEQAATVTGDVDGAPVASAGRRGERPGGDTLTGLDSVREMATWFDGEGVVALCALRPRKHKGHEQDAVHAAVVDPAGPVTIVDPRLSATYAADGRARRVGLELWSDDEEQPPVRVVAEALGTGGRVTAGGWDLTVDWLAGHRRGHDGAGVYLVARPV